MTFVLLELRIRRGFHFALAERVGTAESGSDPGIAGRCRYLRTDLGREDPVRQVRSSTKSRHDADGSPAPRPGARRSDAPGGNVWHRHRAALPDPALDRCLAANNAGQNMQEVASPGGRDSSRLSVVRVSR